MKYVLGIKYGGHDSSAALLVNGKLVAACAQERFSRINIANYSLQKQLMIV